MSIDEPVFQPFRFTEEEDASLLSITAKLAYPS
jgi:hypothetical protein